MVCMLLDTMGIGRTYFLSYIPKLFKSEKNSVYTRLAMPVRHGRLYPCFNSSLSRLQGHIMCTLFV